MHIDLTYHYLTHHVVPGPQSFTYFVPLILLPIALLIPRSVLSRWQSIMIFLPVMAACTIDAWRRMSGVDVISVDVLLWALFMLALRDPWKDFRLLFRNDKEGVTDGLVRRENGSVEVGTGLPAPKGGGDDDHDDEQTTLIQSTDDTAQSVDQDAKPSYSEQPYPANFWQRIPWVGTLLVSIRLNDWKINSPSHDKAQPAPPAFKSRRAFVVKTVVSFIRGYLVLDLTRAYISHDPYFTDLSIPLTSPLPLPILRAVPPQLLRTMVVGAQAWALISQMFYLPCLLPIGLNSLGWLPDQWSPHTWPPYFGSPDAIFLHGVKGFWGQYWHQTMRWSVSAPGYALADALGLRSGGLGRYTLISVVAFGLSGAIHIGLVPPEPLHATLDVNMVRLYVAMFFWTQPMGMLAETVAVSLMGRMSGLAWWQSGIGLRLRWCINGIWVITWFSMSLALLAEAGRQLGYWRVWPVPVSVWKGLRGEGWVTWPFLIE